MPHDTHVQDGFNNDMGMMLPEQARSFYLELVEGWRDPYPDPVIVNHNGVLVVRDDLLGDGVGTKARAADFLVSKAPSDTIVYVQPRVGLAGLSLIDVAHRHGKRVVLFMPASRRISLHQACTIERGGEPVFRRIAAMPNLNTIAERWAHENGAYFVPLGLRHPYATAALVKVASRMDAPRHAWVATSTGVLTRALQIAWPDTRFTSIAVSRNMKSGELGRARVISEQAPFLKEETVLPPPFPSVSTYDAKVWKFIPGENEVETPGNLMWNVGKDPVLADEGVYDRVDSNVDWVRK